METCQLSQNKSKKQMLEKQSLQISVDSLGYKY